MVDEGCSNVNKVLSELKESGLDFLLFGLRNLPKSWEKHIWSLFGVFLDDCKVCHYYSFAVWICINLGFFYY